MTDRHAGYIVTLEKELRSDDAEAIINALRMVRGVLSVEPVVSDPIGHIAKQTSRHELVTQIWAVLYPERKARAGRRTI